MKKEVEETEDLEEEENSEDESLDVDEVEEIFEEDAEFDARLKNFLANQRAEVSLENLVEIGSASLEERLPRRQEVSEESEEKINYFNATTDMGQEYQAFSPEANFTKNNLSEEEKNLENQKMLYDNFASRNPGLQKEKSDWGIVTSEDTMQKDYLMKKKFE